MQRTLNTQAIQKRSAQTVRIELCRLIIEITVVLLVVAIVVVVEVATAAAAAVAPSSTAAAAAVTTMTTASTAAATAVVSTVVVVVALVTAHASRCEQTNITSSQVPHTRSTIQMTRTFSQTAPAYECQPASANTLDCGYESNGNENSSNDCRVICNAINAAQAPSRNNTSAAAAAVARPVGRRRTERTTDRKKRKEKHTHWNQ